MVVSAARSMRSVTPLSSSRRNISPTEHAPAVASMTSAARVVATAGSGWTTARSSIHGSRGRIQTISSGSTPLSISEMQASVAVLPEPTTTYWLGASARWTRSLTVTTVASSSTSNGAGEVAGISGG